MKKETEERRLASWQEPKKFTITQSIDERNSKRNWRKKFEERKLKENWRKKIERKSTKKIERKSTKKIEEIEEGNISRGLIN